MQYRKINGIQCENYIENTVWVKYSFMTFLLMVHVVITIISNVQVFKFLPY